jgi:hypothetical protein
MMAEKSENDVAPGLGAKKPSESQPSIPGYEAEALAMRAKTERLRALRLAREAEQGASRPAKTVAKRGAGKKKEAAKPAGTLADWIKAREEGGHHN